VAEDENPSLVFLEPRSAAPRGSGIGWEEDVRTFSRFALESGCDANQGKMVVGRTKRESIGNRTRLDFLDLALDDEDGVFEPLLQTTKRQALDGFQDFFFELGRGLEVVNSAQGDVHAIYPLFCEEYQPVANVCGGPFEEDRHVTTAKASDTDRRTGAVGVVYVRDNQPRARRNGGFIRSV
jgi:hypothetical protein